MAFEDWSTNPANNGVVVGVTYWPPNMQPSQVDNTGRQMMADLAAWRAAPKFNGNLLFTATFPQIEFNSGGPRIRAVAANTLAVFTDGTANERMRFAPDGVTHVKGKRNDSGVVAGDGNVRVIPADPGGVALTATDVAPFTALQCVYGTTPVGSITVSATGVTYNTTSDERLKDNFRDFDSGALIDELWVGEFDWKVGGVGRGVRAQQAAGVVPDAVTPGLEGAPWSVDYSRFVPLLLREVQRLRARVSQLEGA